MKNLLNTAKEKRKILIIILSLFAVFLIYIFFGCTYSFSTGTWSCSSPGPRWKQAVLESVCTVGGGLSEYTTVMWGSKSIYSCIKPFSDYGKSCVGHNDCEGQCERVGPIPQFCGRVDKWEYKCAREAQGTCSPKLYDIFDEWKEVAGNRIIVHEGAIM